MKNKAVNQQDLPFSELSIDKIEIVKRDTVQSGLKRTFQIKAGLPEKDRISSLSKQSLDIIKILSK